VRPKNQAKQENPKKMRAMIRKKELRAVPAMSYGDQKWFLISEGFIQINGQAESLVKKERKQWRSKIYQPEKK
jgi:hypothetical protein